MSNKIKESEFFNFTVDKVKNGYVLTFNVFLCSLSKNTFIFKNLEELSDFIKSIE